jgi:hypothetical protein
MTVVVALAVLVGGLLGVTMAWALFSATSAAEANTFTADALPQGNTPTASVTPANSPTVTTTFAQAHTTTGNVPITTYVLNRYPTPGAGTLVGTCSAPSGGTVTCTDTPGNGTWQYTDTPVYDNWVGTASAKSTAVVVDGTTPVALPPTVAATVTFGTNPIWVNTKTGENVTLTDSPTDVGGTGVASVAYYYCLSTAGSCTSGTPWVSIGSSSTSGTNWSVPWSSLPADATYNVVAVATGNNTSMSPTSAATLVGVDSTPPTVSTPSVNGFS